MKSFTIFPSPIYKILKYVLRISKQQQQQQATALEIRHCRTADNWQVECVSWKHSKYGREFYNSKTGNILLCLTRSLGMSEGNRVMTTIPARWRCACMICFGASHLQGDASLYKCVQGWRKTIVWNFFRTTWIIYLRKTVFCTGEVLATRHRGVIHCVCWCASLRVLTWAQCRICGRTWRSRCENANQIKWTNSKPLTKKRKKIPVLIKNCQMRCSVKEINCYSINC